MPMEIKAVVRSLPITPRKIRLVADIIRRKSVDEAEKTLMLLAFLPGKLDIFNPLRYRKEFV